MKTAFEDDIEAFKAHMLGQGYAKRTIEEYERDLGPFVEFLEKREVEAAPDVTRNHIVAYQNYLATGGEDGKHKITVGTQAKKIAPVKTFFKFLFKHNRILSNPAADIEFPRLPRRLPRGILSIAEMKRLLSRPDLATAWGQRDRALMELLYSTGIRRGEALSLTIHDIDFEKEEIVIHKGKGGKERVLPIGWEALRHLAVYIREGRSRQATDESPDTLFLSKYGNPIGPSHVLKRLKRYAKSARIKKKVGFHTFRHSCASHMLAAGCDIRYIQALLGHESVSSTQIYTRVEIKDLKRIHRKAHPREKGR